MKVGLLLDGDIDFPGGVQTYVKGLYNFLVKSEHQAVIICGGGEGKSEKVGFRVARLGKAYNMKGIGTQISAYADWVGKNEIKEILVKEKLDILHLQGLFGILGMRFLDHFEGKTVATFHNYWEPEFLPTSVKLLFPLLKHYIEKLDDRVVDSKPAKDFVNQIYSSDYTIIPPGVDLGKFKQAAKRDFSDDRPVTVLFVGRLDRRKGIMFLLKAFRKVQKKVDKARLLIVGEGPQKDKACDFVLKHKLDNVEFVGFVDDENLPRFYAAADIFCSPAVFGESFGIVLLEAMAGGLPIVAFANAGYIEVIKGKGARFLVKPEDAEKLADALITLAKDKNLREEMSRWSLAEVQQYSWEKVGQKILEFYQKLLSL